MNKIFTTILISTSLYSASCWTSNEVASFAQDEFNNKARFSIKDAVTCKPISYAEFSLGTIKFKADKNGIVTLPLPPEDMDRELPITMSRDGYATAKESVLVTFGSYWNNLFLMSKEIPIDSVRFVLSWGFDPKDLDLHLKSDSYHISFRKTKNIDSTVKLDRDATKGYGPETITLEKLKKSENYRVLVNRYSSTGTMDNKTQLRVYKNNKVDKIVRLENTTSKCVEVATIHNNKISYKTKILADSECK